MMVKRGRTAQVQVQEHVGEVLAAVGADVQLGLGESRDAAVGELDAAGEAHELVRLEHADLDDGVGVQERPADAGTSGRACPRARRSMTTSSSMSTMGTPSAVQTSAEAADLVGARHLGGAVAAARAVGHERLGPGRLERAQHGAQGLGVRAHGLLRRRASQQVDLHGDALARAHSAAQPPNGSTRRARDVVEPRAVLGLDVADGGRRAGNGSERSARAGWDISLTAGVPT